MWDNKQTVIVGNYGEKIVKEYLETKGYIVYKPMTNGSHPFDNLLTKGKDKICIAEVKTKPKMKKYNCTGFNYNHYLEYKAISKKHNLDVFIFFVDWELKAVYG